MITIKLVDARKGLHSKCVELFKDLKIAESIYRYLCEGIEECEYAEPERKKGKWIYLDTWGVFKCSICEGQMIRNVFPFCPWCGAEMRKETEDDNIFQS